jgi:ferredoxin
MNRKDFLNKSVGFLFLASLASVECASHPDKKRVKYKIQSELCKGCKKCIKACDRHAISIEGDIVVIDQNRCKGCGDCRHHCENSAIKPVEA